ncbi:MAG TPA: phosphoglycerate kinase [Synergistales bacterium]|nr:phosphoglycerate kinase [Synergistales bacterium]HRV70559.1 phosphoglycerate kinase [Thermovirgaceae bacterium]
MALRTFEGVPLEGLKVLVRVDFNVPMKNGKIKDDSRIIAHLETITALKNSGACVVLISHLGRPNGKADPAFSLRPVAEALSIEYGIASGFVADCVGREVASSVKAMRPRDVLLLENARFHPEEESNDPSFAKKLAEPFDCFVMDAFSASHRAHASTEGVTAWLPSYAGRVMEKEVSVLSTVRENPTKPLVLVMGGAKVSDKIRIIKYMIDRTDSILVGGAMAFPFLKALGKNIGSSFCEEGTEETALEILEMAEKAGARINLPVDVIVSDSIENSRNSTCVSLSSIPNNMMGLDIGPKTAEQFSVVISGAKTVLWNGPMGVFETPPFGSGTKTLGESVAKATSKGTLSVLGGGDTAAAAKALGFSDGISHISTGGGATLEFFEGRDLPGIKPLETA